MNQAATLHRHLDLIRCLRPPYLYYNLPALCNALRDKGYGAVSERTVERDLQDIRHEYGLAIRYDRRRRGYCLDLPTEQDVSDFDDFVQLLERRERLEFLSSAVTSPRGVSRYLQLEHNPQFTGAQHLPLLWEALRSDRAVHFTYAPYTNAEVRRRTVEPGLLFEFRNRWYLDGHDLDADGMRTFGLDRMTDVQLTNRPIRQQRSEQYRTYRQHAIGVTCQPDREPERVLLRFSVAEYPYVQSLPLHPSQREVDRDERGWWWNWSCSPTTSWNGRFWPTAKRSRCSNPRCSGSASANGSGRWGGSTEIFRKKLPTPPRSGGEGDSPLTHSFD